jgi:sugar phosphate isomerase/epimerase
MNRRRFLHHSLAGAAGLTLGLGLAREARAQAARKLPVGVQLYSVREQCKQDLPGTLKQVGGIGYKGVEWAGYHGRSAKELKQMCDDNGLVTCGTHTPYDSVLGDKLKETIEFNQVLGNKYLIVPWMTGKTKADWEAKVKVFNELVPKVQPHGMYVGYHAHAHDFELLEGVSAWDIFFGGTLPAVVMQLDTSNCLDGKADPVAVLKKYPGRARTIHIKPNGGGPEAAIGEDKVKWSEVFAFCEGPGGTDWYIVEHESSKQPVDAIRRCYAALKQMGKV